MFASCRAGGSNLIPSLSFKKNHVEFITCKALRILGFIYRNTSNFHQTNCLKMLYASSLVRSILEYGSVIWPHYVQIDSQKIESVKTNFFLT